MLQFCLTTAALRRRCAAPPYGARPRQGKSCWIPGIRAPAGSTPPPPPPPSPLPPSIFPALPPPCRRALAAREVLRRLGKPALDWICAVLIEVVSREAPAPFDPKWPCWSTLILSRLLIPEHCSPAAAAAASPTMARLATSLLLQMIVVLDGGSSFCCNDFHVEFRFCYKSIVKAQKGLRENYQRQNFGCQVEVLCSVSERIIMQT
ncbi:hypothetical protein EJB05_55935, partial [Eragrostis curvula]